MKKENPTSIRLDKLLASSAHGSRKEVRSLLREGRLSLDGKPLTDPSFKVVPEEIRRLLLDGRPFEACLTPLIMMNKAAGKITAMEDKRIPTVASDLPRKWLNKGLAPIGRLDRDTTGLLLFTNDGQLNHRLSSPKYQIEKQYLVGYIGLPMGEEDVELMARGLKLEDGTACLPARLISEVDTAEVPGNLSWDGDMTLRLARLVLTEGKFHQVKRMFARLGREVIRLHRESMAGLHLPDNLDRGACRQVGDDEKASVYERVGLTPPLF